VVLGIISGLNSRLKRCEMSKHKRGCYGQSLVKIQRSDDGLEYVSEVLLFIATAASLLSLAKKETMSEFHLAGCGRETLSSDDGGPQGRQLALLIFRQSVVEAFGYNHAQHRVTQKLKPLVAGEVRVRGFIEVARVEKSLLQQGRVVKNDSNPGFALCSVHDAHRL
jgi:hypothetical protein